MASPAMQLLQQVWEHKQEATGHSWLKLNHAMADALSLAIRAGMRFDVDDFGYMSRAFRSDYWIGDGERFYELAVLYRNASAYQAFEASRRRKPFIVKGASVSRHTGDGPCGQGLSRLIIGAKFRWQGQMVTVTSFRDGDDPHLIACSYRREGDAEVCATCKRTIAWGKDVLAKRYTITHADLRAAKKPAATPPTPEVPNAGN